MCVCFLLSFHVFLLFFMANLMLILLPELSMWIILLGYVDLSAAMGTGTEGIKAPVGYVSHLFTPALVTHLLSLSSLSSLTPSQSQNSINGKEVKH